MIGEAFQMDNGSGSFRCSLFLETVFCCCCFHWSWLVLDEQEKRSSLFIWVLISALRCINFTFCTYFYFYFLFLSLTLFSSKLLSYVVDYLTVVLLCLRSTAWKTPECPNNWLSRWVPHRSPSKSPCALFSKCFQCFFYFDYAVSSQDPQKPVSFF